VVWRVQRKLDVHLPGEISELLEFVVIARDPGSQAVEDVPSLDLRVEGGDQDFLAVFLPANLNDELPRNLPRGSTEVLVARIALIELHAGELDLHRREAEVVDVLDPVPQRPAFARQRDSGRPKTNHELTPTKKPPLDYYSGLPDINIFASVPGFGRGRGALPHEPAVA